MSKLIILLLALVVVGGGILLFSGNQGASTNEVGDAAFEGVDTEGLAGEEGVPEVEEEEPFPPTKLYNFHGFLDCGYFWNDVRAACPEVKQTQWNSNEPWDIDAGPLTCKMKALGSDEGEFLVNVSRSESAAAADSVYNQARASFASIGFKTIDVSGLGEKAYTVPDPYSDVQTGYNYNVKKGAWLVDTTSSIPEFCATEAQTKDVVQRILRKLP